MEGSVLTLRFTVLINFSLLWMLNMLTIKHELSSWRSIDGRQLFANSIFLRDEVKNFIVNFDEE